MNDPEDYETAKAMMDKLEREHRRTNWLALAIVLLSVVLGVAMMLAFT